MANNTHITNSGGGGVIYIGGPGVPWDGAGVPWEEQGTSPFKIAMNDAAPMYTPTAPAPAPIYSGGPPFRVGSDLAWQSYENVTETIGVQAYATTHDNAVALIRLLKRALMATLASGPPILVYQPDGASVAIQFQILSATVQEDPRFTNLEAKANPKVVRVLITWTRSSFGARLAPATVVNAQSFTNSSSSSANVRSLGTSGLGDLTAAGGPLNIRVSGFSAGANDSMLVATVDGHTHLAGFSQSFVTTSIAPENVGSIGTLSNLNAFQQNPNLRGRVLLRVNSPSLNLQVRARIGLVSGVTLWVGPWVSAPMEAAVDVRLFDMGGCNLFPIAYNAGFEITGSTNLVLSLEKRSTDGEATTGSLGSAEWLIYHTFGIATISVSDPNVVEVRGANALNLPTPTMVLSEAAGNFSGGGVFNGRPPVYIANAFLWMAFRSKSTWNTFTSLTATVTANAPGLYVTMGGAG